MRDLHLLWALKEGGHKWNSGMKRDGRGAALKGDIFLASGACMYQKPIPGHSGDEGRQGLSAI